VTSPLRRRWRPFAAGAACALVIASLGGALTDLSDWYFALQKPVWQPPDWLFGPAWTVIFALCAYSFGLAWQAAPSLKLRLTVASFFLLNMLLNVAWSWLFFTRQRPDYALFEVAWLWLSILVLIYVLRPLSRRAAQALWPYLAWVSFAAVLNVEIVRLNAPFGSP
jgi:translocator protein